MAREINFGDFIEIACGMLAKSQDRILQEFLNLFNRMMKFMWHSISCKISLKFEIYENRK